MVNFELFYKMYIFNNCSYIKNEYLKIILNIKK